MMLTERHIPGLVWLLLACCTSSPPPWPTASGEAGTLSQPMPTLAAGAPATETAAGASPAGVDPGAGSSGMDAPLPAASAAPICGNGIPEPSELCDANCPSSCDDHDPCTEDTLQGDALRCNAQCEHQVIVASIAGDGCCPMGAKHDADADCPASCGDGVVDAGETCEPSSRDKPCPGSCDDGDPCTEDTVIGTAAQCNLRCSSTPITAPTRGDHCCPKGANANTDSDCQAVCGNGVREGGELCDGNCPGSCDDGDPCTVDLPSGSAAQCTAACTHRPAVAAPSRDGCCPNGANANLDGDCQPVCGNGVVERSETCDGDCPTSCGAGSGCTRMQLVGSASRCTAECIALPILAAASGDGCCPPGANANSDSDCTPYCGNGVKEGSETCDGDCPTSASCSSRSGCAQPVLRGAAALCSAVCEMTTITAAANGDGCCPPNANANNDDDCRPVCGNKVKEPGEMCDGIDCPENDLHCKDDDLCSVDRLEGTGCDRHCAPHTREPLPCTGVSSDWNLGTISSGSCPQGFAYAGTDLPEINGTTSIWCGAEHPLRCTAGDRCASGTAPGSSPILCVMQRGEHTCPAGTSGRYYADSNNPITACCGGR